MTTEEEKIEDFKYMIKELEAENTRLRSKIDLLTTLIEKRKLSIIYQFNNWIIRDELGVLATDKTLTGALKKL